MLLCMASYVCAGERLVVIKKPTPIITPQSPQQEPLITGEYDEEELTVDFAGYNGNVDITIVDAINLQIVCIENEAISSPASVNIDLSSLPSSTYYIFIELDNGDGYYASIQI